MLFAFMWKNQDTVWFKHCNKFYQLLDAQKHEDMYSGVNSTRCSAPPPPPLKILAFIKMSDVTTF